MMDAQTRSDGRPLVSAIIPTTLRAELRRAIESVVEQDIDRQLIELVVVVDGTREEWLRSSLVDLSAEIDVLVFTGGRGNGGYARQLGVKSAGSDFVAFLDDDDEWLPAKIRTQLESVDAQAQVNRRAVVASRVLQQGQDGLDSRPIPRRRYEGGDLERYLFLAKGPTPGRSAIYTSTLFVSRALALEIPWHSGLPRHQDWDWILRLANADGVSLIQLDEALTRVYVGSIGSISASAKWEESLDWALAVGSSWEPKVLSDFLSAQPLRYALQARSVAGVRRVAGEILRARAFPSAPCLALGLAGAIPRRALERAFLRMSRGGN